MQLPERFTCCNCDQFAYGTRIVEEKGTDSAHPSEIQNSLILPSGWVRTKNNYGKVVYVCGECYSNMLAALKAQEQAQQAKEEARERARIQWEEKKKRKAKLRSRIYIALCFFIIIFSFLLGMAG